MVSIQLSTFVLLCLASDVNFVLSLTCDDQVCEFGTQDECSWRHKCKCRDGFTGLYKNERDPDVHICLEDCYDNGDSDCSMNTQCTLLKSSKYVCLCAEGFYLSREGMCVDIDECLRYETCSSKNNTVCVNTVGSFACECLSGYNTSITNPSCHDIDECIRGRICGGKNNTVCVNTMGSFECQCLSGYGTSIYNTSCHDIDECEEDSLVCGEHSTCINLPGNYSCDCIEGYTLTMNGNSTCVPEPPSTSPDASKNNTNVSVVVGSVVGGLFLGIIILIIGVLFYRRKKHSSRGTGSSRASINQTNVACEASFASDVGLSIGNEANRGHGNTPRGLGPTKATSSETISTDFCARVIPSYINLKNDLEQGDEHEIPDNVYEGIDDDRSDYLNPVAASGLDYDRRDIEYVNTSDGNCVSPQNQKNVFNGTYVNHEVAENTSEILADDDFEESKQQYTTLSHDEELTGLYTDLKV